MSESVVLMLVSAVDAEQIPNRMCLSVGVVSLLRLLSTFRFASCRAAEHRGRGRSTKGARRGGSERVKAGTRNITLFGFSSSDIKEC